MTALVITVLTVLANGLLGLVVFIRNRRSVTNILFAILTLVVMVWAILNYFSLQTLDPIKALWWIRSVMMSVALMFPVIFLLAKVFPYSEWKVKNWVIGGVVLTTILIMGLSGTSLIFETVQVIDGSVVPVPGRLIPLFGFHVLVYLGMTILILINKRQKLIGQYKNQVGLMLLGLVLTFVTSFVTTFFLVVVMKSSDFVIMGPPLTLVLVGFVAYAIVKHKFLDITALVARTVAYTLLIGVVVGIEVVSVVLVTRLLPFEIDQTVVAVSASVLIILGYDPLRRMITKLTERIFYKGRYNTEELLSELTHIMAGTIQIKKLSQTLLIRMTEELKLTWAGIVLVKDGEIVGVESVGREKGKLYDPKLKELLKRTKREVCVFEDLTDESLKELFREKGLSVAIPLMIKKREVGILVLGPKASGDVINGQDRQFLEILAPQAAVAINNARSYREIQEFSKTLEKKVEERTEELRGAQKQKLAKADELLRLKDEFVFIASHDLASPVTAITGYIDLLRMSKIKMSKRVREDLEAIDQASERLKDLVDDLLQVARGESGTIKVELVDVKINEVVEKSLKIIEGRAKKKKIKIVSKMPKTLGKVRADKDKLSEVIDNLLTNAVKYGKEKGEVVVSGRRDGSWVVIEVEDDGIGIPKAEQKQIFTKFFRSETREARTETGTGLGLFVVKMLIAKMKGKISFSSEEGKGTKFVIRLKRSNLR